LRNTNKKKLKLDKIKEKEGKEVKLYSSAKLKELLREKV